MLSPIARQRQDQLRRREPPGVVSLWVEALGPEERLRILGGIEDSWARVGEAKAHLELGVPVRARAVLDGVGPLPGGLSRMAHRLSCEIDEALAQAPDKGHEQTERRRAAKELSRWLGKVNRWRKPAAG